MPRKRFTATGVESFTKTENPADRKSYMYLMGSDDMEVSDGYHTFTELYDHRIELYIAMCRLFTHLDKLAPKYVRNNRLDMAASSVGEEPVEAMASIEMRRVNIWRSKLHSDGSGYEGWFILGVGKEKGEQITYHLPESRWEDTNFAETLDKAPEWDGHTPADVITRLKTV